MSADRVGHRGNVRDCALRGVAGPGGYEREAHVTDVFVARDAAIAIKPPTNAIEALFTPPKPRGALDQALAAAAVRAQPADEATFARVAEMLLRDAKGCEHNSFKIDLARRCIVRALSQAARGTPQSQSSKKIV